MISIKKIDPNDIIDKTFGKLKVVKFSHRNTNCNIFYDCICDCGKESKILRNHLITGNTKQCLKCKNKNQRIEKGEAGFNRAFTSVKYGAKTRNLEFNLTKEDFKQLVDQKCHYCNSEPQIKTVPNNKYGYTEETYNHAVYTHNGIDRIDSSKGYNLNNVVTCCTRCNIAKNDMSYDEFLLFIEKVFNYIVRNNKNA